MGFERRWRLAAAIAVANVCNCTVHQAWSWAPGPEPAQSASGESQPAIGRRILYRNEPYGFCFSLPDSWRGYTIVQQEWSGGPPGSEAHQHGPKLLIRHPGWTADEPYEDIPIMIFSHPQWELVVKEQLVVSAAPIPPSELARNAHYVFALPPRYNFDFATGYEEVDALIKAGKLRAPCGKDSSSGPGETPARPQ